MQRNYTRVKLACYTTNISMSIIGNLSPVLFLTFRHLYGISYSLLGLLVLVNFCTQLAVDLLFSFFSHKINIPFAVKITPILTIVGLLIYAICPFFLTGKYVYIAILIGTVIFSASSGLSEVLISPVIAAIPSKNPERSMSMLHSIYAWGVVAVILISTAFLFFVGQKYWQWLALGFILVPAIAALLFFTSKLPKLETPERASNVVTLMKKKELWLCVLAIFLGGASECTMAQWCSAYLEQALGISKVWGDIFGVAMFAAMLGLGRTLYAKIGKHVEVVLLAGSAGAACCYLGTALFGIPVLGLIACALTGFCVSMLWPGSLVVASKRIPTGGVFIYAMMAAGGDLGASVGPQLIGVITDVVQESAWGLNFAQTLGMGADQLGMKIGMLVGMLFPLIGTFVFLHIFRTRKKYEPKLLQKEGNA